MVGLIFQQFHLVPTMTALENVALPLLLAGVAPTDRRSKARRALDQVGLAARTDHPPAALSGGEQQRVATARALVGDPPLLLADEPTGNLDTDTGAQIIDLLTRLHAEHNRTVIVVTHHLDEIADVSERIVQLRDGRLAFPCRLSRTSRGAHAHPAMMSPRGLNSPGIDGDDVSRHPRLPYAVGRRIFGSYSFRHETL
jgi:predicted ABC-type transport system involved in lysophospholipase L1 biosynthesis ATPase subunit